jgi:hypothetical protein
LYWAKASNLRCRRSGYLEAVQSAFIEDIDYSMHHKIDRSNPEGQTRYSPAQCTGCKPQTISGPQKHIGL